MRDNMAKELSEIQDIIWRVLERNRFGVLATQRNGQPHASLVAFTALNGLRFLAFATYRETLKYESIREDPRVAILIEDREGDVLRSGRRLVLTAVGVVVKTPEKDREADIAQHLARHPELKSFLSSPGCEFVRVAIHSYQVVTGIDDARLYAIGNLTDT